jgi:hypothetical protein
MDAESFNGSDMSANSTGCSACGQEHTWDRGQAYLDS